MKKIIAATSALATSALFATQAFAVSFNPCPTNNGQADVKTSFAKLCNVTAPENILSNIFTVILVAAVIIALAFLIWGGIKWIMSGGDKTKVETARNTIIGAIIGLIIAFLAFFIISLVGSLFGITLLGGSGSSSAVNNGLPDILDTNGSSGGTQNCPAGQHFDISNNACQ